MYSSFHDLYRGQRGSEVEAEWGGDTSTGGKRMQMRASCEDLQWIIRGATQAAFSEQRRLVRAWEKWRLCSGPVSPVELFWNSEGEFA